MICTLVCVYIYAYIFTHIYIYIYKLTPVSECAYTYCTTTQPHCIFASHHALPSGLRSVLRLWPLCSRNPRRMPGLGARTASHVHTTHLSCSNLLLAALRCSWLLLAAPGCSWLLLVALGCSWLLLAAPGCPWLFMAPLECSRLLRSAPCAPTMRADDAR